MAVTINDFLEMTSDGVSPCHSQFGMQTSRSLGVYLISVDEISDLQDAVTLLLGGTSSDVTDGRLTRSLPTAHPSFWNQYVSFISSIKGLGVPERVDPNPGADSPTLPKVALYEQYEFSVEFSPRLYAVVPDEDIEVVRGNYYDLAGNVQPYFYATEFNRFVDWQPEPNASNLLSVQQGEMILRGQTGVAPDGFPFVGSPRIVLPDDTIRCVWYYVPLRYLTSPRSYLRSWRGYINQNPMPIFDADAGQIAYVNYHVERFPPPSQELDAIAPGISALQTLCNVTLFFERTERTATVNPSVMPTNLNSVVGGWNLQPWLGRTRGFFYASASTGDPMWGSAPLEQLFTDPDAF